MAVDAYKSYLDTERTRLEGKDKYIKTDLKQACTAADKNVDAKYTDFRMAKALSNQCQEEKQSIEQKIKDLIAEKNLKIARAKEEAKADGKSDAEIETMVASIESEYTDKVALLQGNDTKIGKTALTKKGALETAQQAYAGARFDNISATGNFLSALQLQFSDWLSFGRMQQNYDVSQAQAKSKNINYLG